ncbi:MAG: aldo/keto reductase [Bacteroidales bacterium]|nr:MAG: aldo/keto reductase [Bacteroidales bacterium]
MNSKKNLKDNRRNFLKKGMVGAAGLSVVPSLSTLNFKGGKQHKMQEKEETKVIYRTLGRTGIKVPVISMGTSSNEYLIKAALKTGIVHYDTANGYGNGLHETTFGRILKDYPRESFVIATKIYGMRDDNGMPRANVTSAEFIDDFRQSMETSLKRLQMDYVDIFYLHAADNSDVVKLNMVKDIMQEFKSEGKTKFLGISTHSTEVIYTIVEEGIYDVILTGYNFRDLETGTVKKAINHAAKAGCGIVGMKGLAGVYWDEERKQPINPKAATKWMLQNEDIHTVILSMNTFEQLEMYWSLMNDLTLTPEEKSDLRLGGEISSTGMYCTQCRQCLPQCPHGVNIPRLMRSYMYAYGYRKPSKAKETLRLVDTGKIKCNECSSCDIECSMGFNIRKKIIDITRIRDIPDEFLV